MLPMLFSVTLAAQVAPPNGAGVSMGHFHIVTADPESQKKLWVDALGGKLVTAGPLEYAMFPGVLIGYRKGESSGGTDGSVVDHLAFAVRDAAATKARLIAGGAQILREMPEAHQFFAMFPGGVKVEFIEDAAMDTPVKHHHLHFAAQQVDEMRAWYAARASASAKSTGPMPSALRQARLWLTTSA